MNKEETKRIKTILDHYIDLEQCNGELERVEELESFRHHFTFNDKIKTKYFNEDY